MSDPQSERPDLTPLRAAASQPECAGAFRGLLSGDGHPLAEGKPLVPLTRDAARSLIEAGSTSHHCGQQDPLHRLSAVRLIAALGVLHGFGYRVQEPGTGGTWLVTGRRDQETGAGR